MSIKLIASDLDGTLVDHNNFIPTGNLDAIEDMNKKHIDFAICTGKTYSITKDICKKCNASYGIFGNGTQIINLKTGQEIYKNLLSVEDFIGCYDLAKQYGFHIHIYSETEVISENLLYMDLRNYTLHQNQQKSDLNFQVVPNVKDYVANHQTSIFKLVISSTENLSHLKDEILSRFDINVTLIQKKGLYKDRIINKEYEYLDITPKHIGKGYALEYLSHFLNIDCSDIMAIGDNINDIDMIKVSGASATLSDSYEEVKKVASYVSTNTAENAGFAEAVYRFIGTTT